MKGIVLAGGSGTRLSPITSVISKQLLPVYDKPMIYYPISVLMLAGIKDILIISTPKDLPNYQDLLGDGSRFGVNFTYKMQAEPKGIGEAFLIAEEFIDNKPCCLILGDNLFFGQGFITMLRSVVKQINQQGGAYIFGYPVHDPERFGVVEFNKQQKVLSIVEKPNNPKSKYAITGLYFYDHQVVNFAKNIKPSHRGELEITDINQCYLEKNELKAEAFGRGFAWLDTGTFDSLIDAGQFVQTLEKRQGFKIACLEEIAFNQEWVTKKKMVTIIQELPNNQYKNYLSSVIND